MKEKLPFLGPFYKDSYRILSKTLEIVRGVSEVPTSAQKKWPCDLLHTKRSVLIDAHTITVPALPKDKSFTFFERFHRILLKIFHPSLQALAWAWGLRRRMKHVFFSNGFSSRANPREAALAADLITASLIRLLVVPGQ